MFFIVAASTFFISTTYLFVHKHLVNRDMDEVDVAVGLLFCLIAAFFWFISIPAVVLIGGAWLLAKVIVRLVNTNARS